MLKALLWKEWQEQRGRMTLATVWLVGMTAIGLKTRILPDGAILGVIWIGTAVVLALFVGMSLFASERNEGTLNFLMVCPVARGEILAAKLILGLLAYMTPFAICGTIACLTVGGREMTVATLIAVATSVIAFGVVALLWQLLIGLRCRREETYALVGLGTLGVWGLYAMVMAELNISGRLGVWMWATAPFTILTLPDWADQPTRQNWAVVVIQSLTLIGLSLILWLRFRGLQEGKS